MKVVSGPSELLQLAGQDLGASGWLAIDQQMIDAFAHATGDLQWIHVDVERASRELPGGRTIAHGYLILSLLPRLAPEILRIENRSRSINYGSNKVRFTNVVPVGSSVRLRQKIAAAEAVKGGVRVHWECTMELEGAERPAFVAETISVIYD